MAETAQDDWHDSRIRPYAKWPTFFGAGWFASCGVFVLLSEQIADPLPDGTAVTPLETAIFVALAFSAAFLSYRAGKVTRLRWNNRTLLKRSLFFAERAYAWSTLTAMKPATDGWFRRWQISAGPKIMNLKFGKKNVKISTKNGFINPRDYAAVEALATQELDDNARTS